MQLKGGVIIIGSLLWQDDLNKNDKVRYNWRNTSLNIDDKILARLPIRYGRYSKGDIYTMVFSTDCEKKKRLGTGYVIPFKNNPIKHLDALVSEARMMARAEGMQCNFVGGINPIWASIGILTNRNKVDQKLYERIISRWAKELRADGGGKDTSEYRVGKEKLSINNKGELQILWPTSVVEGEKGGIQELDFLIAASTKPKYEQQGKTKYPSPTEIAASVRRDSGRRYFMNNFHHRITTFQDNLVINLL